MNDIPSLKPADEKLRIRAAIAAIGTAFFLMLLKLLGFFMTGSLAILSSVIDSGLDILASTFNLLAIRKALVPPDDDHRFGHGKAEPLAGLAQSLFVGGSAVFLFVESLPRLIAPEAPTHTLIGLGVMSVSLLCTILLVMYQRSVIRRSPSLAIEADSLHYSADVLMNGSIIISLIAGHFTGITLIDPLFALFIVFYLLHGAYEIACQSIDVLMDRESTPEERHKIVEIICAHKGVLGVHDVRTRHTGTHLVMQFHLDLDGKKSLYEAHEIGDAVEASLKEAFPVSDIMIHLDPVSPD